MSHRYIIITPAYNEERYIAATIDSVAAQSIPPALWVIIDDGSSDGTGKIIQEKARSLPWLRYLYRPKVKGQSYYASNVFAIDHGLETVKDVSYDFLAILDADIVLDPDYYERIFALFAGNPRLGIASGINVFPSPTGPMPGMHDKRSCPKNIMVFRPECFRDIGGFRPLRHGGEDTCACFLARMKGWDALSFADIRALHAKPPGSGHATGMIRIRFKQGIEEYYLATHPLFLFAKCVRRSFRETPFLLSGPVRFFGYLYAMVFMEKRSLEPDLVSFIQKDQLSRLLPARTA